MTIITDYAFGGMTIEGRHFSTDLIILPDGRMIEDWYRQAGHLLTEEDLAQVLQESPRLIIAGTGAYGRMAIAPGLETALENRGIQLRSMETAKAVDLYNTEARQKRPGLCGCFHLTC